VQVGQGDDGEAAQLDGRELPELGAEGRVEVSVAGRVATPVTV
jgi:hypothetical protein